MALIGVGLAPLLLFELGLRLAGLGQVATAQDPYVGFVDVQPLFVHNRETERFEIPSSRVLFQPDWFAAEKGAREFRIFCLGGSTVQGRPYGIETAFPTWLELALQASAPQRQWRVVNCGGISYASYRLAPIMQEVIQYAPDLLILYAGHNEFLEARSYRAIKQTAPWVARAHRQLSSSRAYNVMRSWFVSDAVVGDDAAPKSPTQLAAEVEALLDYRGGLAAYRRDPVWREGVVQHFAFNLARMVRMAQQAGVPILLLNPVADLKDTPPFKVLHGDQVSDAERQRFDDFRRAAGFPDSTSRQRIESLLAAVAIDPQHAGAQFELARSLAANGEYVAAEAAFVAAKDEDLCPLRMTEALHRALLRAAEQAAAHWFDARALFAGLSADGIVGGEWLVDHVHPSIRGHQRIAAATLGIVAELAGLPLAADHRTRMQQSFAEHLESLDPIYYIKGRQQLEGLRMWSKGRSNRRRRPR